MTRNLIALLILCVSLFVLAPGCTGQTAAKPEDFYKDKTIEIIVSETPGNDHDLISRIIADYLRKDTGCNVIVTNRRGANGLDGINYVAQSKPDGLTLGTMVSLKFVTNKILEEPAATYELSDFAYIGGIDRITNYFMVAVGGPYQSLDALKTGKGLILAGSSPSGGVALAGLTMIKILNLDAKLVSGMGNESQRALAAKRGEVAGYASDIPASKASMSAGLVKPLFVIASKRDKIMPDVPALTELIDIKGQDLELVKSWGTSLCQSSITGISKNVPEDRVQYLGSLFKKWIQDDNFKNDIDRALGQKVGTYMTADEVKGSMDDLLKNATGYKSVFKELIEKYRK